MPKAKDIYGGWGDPNDSKAKRAEMAKRMFYLIADKDPNCIPFEIVGKVGDTPKKTMAYQAVRKVYGKDTPNYAQQHGSCLRAGSPVRMADGSEKSIENVKIGDLVVSHTGQVRQVVNTFQREYTGNMITLNCKKFPFPLTITADHPIVCTDGKESHGDWWPQKIVRKHGGELEVGDHIIVGKLPDTQTFMLDVMNYISEDKAFFVDGKVRCYKGRAHTAIHRYIPINEKLSRLLGLYLAEGCVSNGRTVFSFNTKEIDLIDDTISLIKELFGIEAKVRLQKGVPNSTRVEVDSKIFGLFIKAIIPGDAHSKRVPSFLMAADNKLKMECLDAWLSGDGYRKLQKRKEHPNAKLIIRGFSASPGLARDMVSIAFNLGYTATSHTRKPTGFTNAKSGYLVNIAGKKGAEEVGHFGPALYERVPNITDSNKRMTKWGYVVDITDIQSNYVENEKVYDIEVEEEHTFIAGGLCQFNCVGMTAKNMLEYVQACEILAGDREQFKLIYQPYVYAAGRKQAGYRSKGDGCYGSASVQGVSKFGSIPADTPGLPSFAEAEYDWSGPTRGEWAFEKYLEEGQKHPITKYSQITTWEQACDAIANGYMIQVCSNRGFNMKVSSDGFHAPNGSWSHSLSLIGYDNGYKIPYGIILNSWGENSHGQLKDFDTDENIPLGCLRVRADVIVKMFQADDSWTYGKYNGFPAQLLNKNLFKLI